VPAATYDAIVLAGGRSTRMGDVDKLGLLVDGRTLLSRACAAVADARRLVVVGPAGRPGLPDGIVSVQEDPPFAGPAAAMGAGLAALGAAAADVVVVLAADVPRAAEAVPVLLTALGDHPERDGVVARSADGRRQPLLAAHRRHPFAAALSAHEPLAHRSATRILSGLDLLEVDLPDDVVADVDTPADLHRLTEETHRG